MQSETDSNDHLQYLQAGDKNVDNLGNSDPHGSESVVGIHDGVDRVVHQSHNSA